jgi:hypothetical protein
LHQALWLGISQLKTENKSIRLHSSTKIRKNSNEREREREREKRERERMKAGSVSKVFA